MRLILISALLASAAFADAVTDWNALLRASLSTESPPIQARLAAMMHLAMFDAVNAIGKQYKPYISGITAAPGASQEAAAISAAHRILRNNFPSNAANLDAELARSLSAIPDGTSKNAGMAVGEAAAAAIIAARANDGVATAMPFTPTPGVGMWQPTPPAFAAAALRNFGKVKPFGISGPEEFRATPPPALTSSRYRRDYNEVKSVGGLGSLARSQYLANVSRFAGSTSPIQMWNSIAVQMVMADPGSLVENARLFALINMAITDAGIAVFDSKFHYNRWRPVTAIRSGDLDGNPGTAADPAFTPFITTPPYPSHPSGFGGLSNAARFILERHFGEGDHPIALSNAALPGVNLQYTRLRQITDDIADARIYGGIHFRFEQTASEDLARRVANYLMQHHLRCAAAVGCEDNEETEAAP